jgi:hypothetical protein
MKNLPLLLATACLFLGISACKDDPVTPDNGVQITGISASAEVDHLGAYGPVTVTINGADGLTMLSVTKNGAAFDTKTLSGTSATYEFSYTATAADQDQNVVFVFEAQDADGDKGTFNFVLRVGEATLQVVVTTNISANTTWTADKTYVLGGRITVLNGATLEIEPGTVIKGEAGTGANATGLLVARGGKLMAEGTSDLPIIFTSVADEITGADLAAGNFASPNLDPDINGLWGGVIVLGKARISASNMSGDVSEVQIEGIPTSDPNGLYGGNENADNSGVLKYISIRHGGTNIGSGNEINGLTLGGVGSGTMIENIEIVANQDDGIEWFGGTVNVKNVVCWNVGDDGIDTDQSWSGTLDNFVVITPAGHSFELDGPEGSYMAGHVIQNGSVIASDDDRVSEDLINTDANSIVDLKNIFITGIADGQMINRVTAAGVTYTGIQLNVDPVNLASHVNGAVPAGITATSTPSVGANKAALGWTWASKSGALDSL